MLSWAWPEGCTCALQPPVTLMKSPRKALLIGSASLTLWQAQGSGLILLAGSQGTMGHHWAEMGHVCVPLGSREGTV